MSGRRLLVALGLWVPLALATVGPLFLVARIGGAGRRMPAEAAALAAIGLYVTLLVAMSIAFGGPSRLARAAGCRRPPWPQLLLMPGAWVLTLVVGGLLTLALRPLLGPAPDTAQVLVKLSASPLYLTALAFMLVILAPVTEEILFRGLFYGWMRTRRLTPWLAAPLSAAVFGLAHLLPGALPALFCFGLGAAVVYELTGSTINTMVMHGFQNATALAVALAAAGAHL